MNAQELRERISGDLHPVESLPSGWRRSAVVLAYAVLAALVISQVVGLKAVPPGWTLVSWCLPSVVGVLLGFLLVRQAVRCSIPAAGPCNREVGLWLGAGLLVHTWMRWPTSAGIEWAPPFGVPPLVICLFVLFGLGGPLAWSVFREVRRGLPTRPWSTGVLLGLAVVLTIEAAWRLADPMADRILDFWLHWAGLLIWILIALAVSGPFRRSTS